MKYFRLRQYYKVSKESLQTPKTDLREKDEDSDKFVLDIVTPWAPDGAKNANE